MSGFFVNVRRLIAEAISIATAAIYAAFAAMGGSSLIGFVQSGLSAVLRSMQDKMRERVSAADFGVLADGVTDDLAALNAATAYASSIGGKVLLDQGIHIVSDEFVIPSNVTIEAMNPVGSNTPSMKQAIIKWKTGVSGVGKSVVRCSASPVGTNPTAAVSASVFRGVKVDATGCDYGLYCFYFSNESALENVEVEGATIANIMVLKSWYARYRDLTAYRGLNAGIVFSYPLSGETGELSVNACDVQSIRAHSNGISNTYDKTTNPSGGAGVIFGNGFRSSNIAVVVSENNQGPGIYAIPNFVTNIGCLHLENNCLFDPTENRALFVAASGNNTPWIIGALYLGTSQRVYSEIKITVLALNRVDNTNSFVPGTAVLNVLTSNLASFAATDWNCVSSFPVQVASFFGVNIRYSASFASAYFCTQEDIYPHYVVVPRATAVLASNFVLSVAPATTLVVDDSRTIGTNFSVGVPIDNAGAYRVKGSYKLGISGTPPATDTIVDIYVFYRKVGASENHK